MGKMISKNFSEDEFRCKCCKRLYVDPEFVKAIQAYRDLIGRPVVVAPGGVYRCPIQNAKDGGAQNSYHISGRAGDFTVPGWTVPQMYEAALQIPAFFNGGIGIYPQNLFVHLDTGAKRRWARIKKKKKDVYVSIDEGLKACSTK